MGMLSFLNRGKSKVSSRNPVTYIGRSDGVDKTALSRLARRIERTLGEANREISTRVWEDSKGLQVSVTDLPPYRIKLFDSGEARLEIPKNHPDVEGIKQVLEHFFDSTFELQGE